MQTEEKIRQFIVHNLYYTDNYIADEDSFLETGVIDSMGVMELVAYVQSEFGITVSQQEIVVDNFDSIRKLSDFVHKKLSAAAGATVSRQVPETPQAAPVHGDIPAHPQAS
jgi:acyl carrier protein